MANSGSQRCKYFSAALRDFAEHPDVAENARRLTFNPVSDPKSDERFKFGLTPMLTDSVLSRRSRCWFSNRRFPVSEKRDRPKVIDAPQKPVDFIQQFVAEVDSTQGEETDGDGVTHSRQGDCLYAYLCMP